ncbi:3-hydroxyacyl-CoA dehydrogenase/enoyl-CoA hydratase family protein [Geothermobacter hydrogeniphilus]|uniref:3-hydroxyacyl-CoA dehydrogenase n=1 Tax=Geothermobacter hydrogeniphilus TaxID=1969733 RepID=A0A1X0Y6B6_9BACT|nr:3-hydroxyacyl-CoA dehydrogenase/enoyl-CoA hydratase family protein [Geothermobacter hydrogeniphilus]ORJ60673.1 3-hydroxyacyl-CoA dehydrogenase [Geothermobacter hydrogeniphilus]
MRQINRVAVLGAGVMGATIAAHLANAGLEVELLDIVPRELEENEKAAGLTLADEKVRNRIAAAGLKGLMKMKPAPFYLKDYAAQIRPGNFEDHLDRLKECDWVVEVVIEHLPIKLQLLEKVVPFLNDRAVLSTNTSGLSVNAIAEALPAEVRKRFLVTHFFNPPRYMRLLEVVGCNEADPQLVAEMAEFLSRRLGKGIVHAKDTPNFIANRIGVYAIYKGIQHMMEMDLGIEDVDAVAGPATARPKSAAFRTADLVGNDTLVHVGNNSYELLPDDEEREVFKVPEFMQQMIEKNLLGNKTRGGFYKKTKDENGKRVILAYDWRTGEYQAARRPKFPSVEAVKQVDDPARRLREVVNGKDQGAEYAWRTLRDTLIYTVNRIPEIADDVVNIDNAMKWGFNWEIGPFEMLDAIGVPAFVARAKKDGVAVPEALEGIECFYRFNERGEREYFDFASRGYLVREIPAGQVDLEVIRRSGGVVEKNAGASLLDLGDGVFCLEFHSKMNSISGDILSLTQKAVKRAEREGVALVVGNEGPNFSVGANLMLLAVALAEGAFEDIDLMVRQFQKATMALKYAKVPTVVAPFGMTLGGGAEYTLHADAVVAHAETYMGLVEIGVGLIPAGGGTKEMCLRAVELATRNGTDVTPFLFKHFQQIGMAKVAMGAMELFDMNYLRRGDSVTMDKSRQIADAKQKALALATNYRPPRPAQDIPAPGRSVAASIKSQLWNMRMGGFVTEYEEQLGGVIADVICGGDVPAGTPISEDYLLKLEREAFLKLCGQKKTAERIQHMLKKGKPLRN